MIQIAFTLELIKFERGCLALVTDCSVYEMPCITFVGGISRSIEIPMPRACYEHIDLTESTAKISVTSYFDKSVGVVLTKDLTVKDKNTLILPLTSSDTYSLRGKFVYQITISNSEISDIPGIGVLNIIGNIENEELYEGGGTGTGGSTGGGTGGGSHTDCMVDEGVLNNMINEIL